MTFALGAQDAEILKDEFKPVFTADNLINLGKYEIAVKMTVDGQTTRPFVAKTLPLPTSSNQNSFKCRPLIGSTGDGRNFTRKELLNIE